jgi:hypothetical protein
MSAELKATKPVEENSTGNKGCEILDFGRRGYGFVMTNLYEER